VTPLDVVRPSGRMLGQVDFGVDNRNASFIKSAPMLLSFSLPKVLQNLSGLRIVMAVPIRNQWTIPCTLDCCEIVRTAKVYQLVVLHDAGNASLCHFSAMILRRIWGTRNRNLHQIVLLSLDVSSASIQPSKEGEVAVK
jgi:hypothetical protein